MLGIKRIVDGGAKLISRVSLRIRGSRKIAGTYHRVSITTIIVVSLFTGPALTSNSDLTDAEASRYPSEALHLADSQIPALASAIASCDANSTRRIRDKVTTFIYKTWNWSANFEKLKAYRSCFQLLGDIIAGTRLVPKQLGAPPRFAVGLLDANYASCQELADPGATPVPVNPQLHWPERLGKEPQRDHCQSLTGQ